MSGTPKETLLARFEALKMPILGAELAVLLNALFRPALEISSIMDLFDQ